MRLTLVSRMWTWILRARARPPAFTCPAPFRVSQPSVEGAGGTERRTTRQATGSMIVTQYCANETLFPPHHVSLCAQLFATRRRERVRETNAPLERLCRGEERRSRTFERDDLGQGRRLARESRVERAEGVDEIPVAVVEAEGEVRVDDCEDLQERWGRQHWGLLRGGAGWRERKRTRSGRARTRPPTRKKMFASQAGTRTELADSLATRKA